MYGLNPFNIANLYWKTKIFASNGTKMMLWWKCLNCRDILQDWVDEQKDYLSTSSTKKVRLLSQQKLVYLKWYDVKLLESRPIFNRNEAVKGLTEKKITCLLVQIGKADLHNIFTKMHTTLTKDRSFASFINSLILGGSVRNAWSSPVELPNKSHHICILSSSVVLATWYCCSQFK